jgi:hypothetical protein
MYRASTTGMPIARPLLLNDPNDIETWGYLNRCRYILHGRDKKFCTSFQFVLSAAGVKPILLPAKSPNLNAYAERWVRRPVEVLSPRRMSILTLYGRDIHKKDRRPVRPHHPASDGPLLRLDGYAVAKLSDFIYRSRREIFSLLIMAFSVVRGTPKRVAATLITPPVS